MEPAHTLRWEGFTMETFYDAHRDRVRENTRMDEYPRIDIMVVRYKWELEGLEQARTAPQLSFPVMPPPYLVAMKLVAGGRKDELDTLDILRGMPGEEVSISKELAKKVRRDKNFAALLRESRR